MAKTDYIIALKTLVKKFKKVSLDGEISLLPDTGNTSPTKLPIKYLVQGDN